MTYSSTSIFRTLGRLGLAAGFAVLGSCCVDAQEVGIQAGPAVVRTALPSHFISFNMNSLTFEANYWDSATRQVRPAVVQAMRAFPAAIYRYPGGLIANGFDWEGATGPDDLRRPQKNVAWQGGAPVRFGPAEYYDFLRQVNGRSWYVLNLVGWDEQTLYKEQGSDVQAASNGHLAGYRREREPAGTDWPRYYHLGNELDRSEFQWPTEKYVQRSLASMQAVRAADPDARFVPFLRDFDWQYRGRPGVSPAKDFARDVLGAMPDAQDYSLQIYYDRPSEEGKTFDVAWRSQLIRNIVDYTTSLRGKPYRVWITEHAKAKPEMAPPAYRLETTSGISGAIASADFLIAMSQQPEVQGVFWHALGGGYWWDLFRNNQGVIEPTPVYWALRLLRENMSGEVLWTSSSGPNASGYEGGYDVRSVVLRNPQTGDIALWAINHANEPRSVLVGAPMPASNKVAVAIGFVAARWPDSALEHEMAILRQAPNQFADKALEPDGQLRLTLPARSVSVVRIRP